MTAQEQSLTTPQTLQVSLPLSLLQRLIVRVIQLQVKHRLLTKGVFAYLQAIMPSFFFAIELSQCQETVEPLPLRQDIYEQRCATASVDAMGKQEASLQQLPTEPRSYVSPLLLPAAFVVHQVPPHNSLVTTNSMSAPVWMDSPSPQSHISLLQRPVVFVHHQQGDISTGRLPYSPAKTII